MSKNRTVQLAIFRQQIIKKAYSHIEKVEEIITMRKEGKLTGDHIAHKLKMNQRTVSRHLIRAKLSRKKDIEDRDEEPPRR